MFANLKKKIESEVGDLSRLTPSNVLNRNTSNSSTLSSRQPSVSSLASEPSIFSPHQSIPEPQSGQQQSSITPSRSSGSSSLHAIKIKQLEEKLQAQESDFAWRLSTKDEEITTLSKTVEILTNQLKNNDSENKRKLVRVQEDIDEMEGFNQQENAKLKHLLLNKEEELGGLRNQVVVRDREVNELKGRVKELEIENERVKIGFEKLRSNNGGGGNNGAKNPVDEERVKSLESQVTELRKEKESISSELDKLRNIVTEKDAEISSLKMNVVNRNDETKELFRKIEEKDRVACDVMQKYDETRKELEASRDSESLLKTDVSNKKKTVLNLEKKIMEASNKLKNFTTDVAKKTEKIEMLEEEVKELKAKATEKTMEESERVTVLEESNAALKLSMDQLKKSVKEKENIIAEITLKRQENEDEMEKTSREYEELKRNSNELTQKLQASLQKEKDNVDLQNRLEKAEKVNEEMRKEWSEIESLKRENEEFVRRIDQLGKVEMENAELSRRVNELEKVRTENSKLQTELNSVGSLATQNEELLQKLENIQVVNSSKELELQNKSKKIEHLTHEKNEISQQLTELKSLQLINAELKSKISQLERRVETDNEQLKDGQSDLIRLRSENEELERKCQEISVLKNNNSELKKHLTEVQKLDQENKQTVQKLERDMELLKLENSSIKNEKDTDTNFFSTENAQLAKSLESLKKDNEILKFQLGETSDSNSEELNSLKNYLREVENEKGDLLVNVSEMQCKIDELEEECRFLKEDKVKDDEEGGKRVQELEKLVAEKDKQLRQQSHALSDLRRSLAKEVKKNEDNVAASESQLQQQATFLNGSVPHVLDDGGDSAAMLPQYETDVNFMYLRSVLFKYLTSQDPQITSHLTRVVATLLHLTEEETQTLIATTESRNNPSHLLSHIIK